MCSIRFLAILFHPVCPLHVRQPLLFHGFSFQAAVTSPHSIGDGRCNSTRVKLTSKQTTQTTSDTALSFGYRLSKQPGNTGIGFSEQLGASSELDGLTTCVYVERVLKLRLLTHLVYNLFKLYIGIILKLYINVITQKSLKKRFVKAKCGQF